MLGFFITTFITLGPIDLVGHLSLLGIMFLLIYSGTVRYRLAVSSGKQTPGLK